MIHTTHERVIAAPMNEVGALLDTLGSHDDRMWHNRLGLPIPLHPALQIGARGGHGPMRFQVVEHVPGNRVSFRFDRRTRLDGMHGFEILPGPDGTTRLRHTLTAAPFGAMHVLWPLVVHALHDTVIEDVHDHVERTLTGTARRVQPAPVRARVVARAIGRRRVVRAPVRTDGLLTAALPRIDAADAWSIARLARDPRDVDTWVSALLGHVGVGGRALLGIRNAAMRMAGRTTGERRPVTGFPVVARTPDELLLGIDDRHLSFRVSVRVHDRAVTMTTIVQIHGAFGRAYWAVVRLVHPLLVRSGMRAAPRRLAATTP